MNGAPPTLAAPAFDARRTARGTLFALLATLLEKGGAMVMLVVVARLLGVEGFGRYAALMSWLALFQVAAELGQEPVLVRLLARDREVDVRTLVAGALALRLVLAVVAGALLVALGAVAFPALRWSPLVLGAAGLVAGSGLALRALFRTTQRLEWLCLTALASVAGFAAALAAVAAVGLGTTGAVAAWATGQLAASLTAGWLSRRRVSPWLRWRAAVAARLARAGLPLALNALLLTATLRMGQLIVLRFEGATAVAYLAAGARLAEAFAVLPEAVMLVLLPILASSEHEGSSLQRAVSVRAVRYLGLLALPVIMVASIAAPTLLAVLFGPAYVAGAPALRVLAWLALLAASGTVFTNLLIARGLERLLLALNALGSCVTLALSLALVPRWGFVGAAVATLMSSVLCQVVLLVLPWTRADVAACLHPLAAPTLVAAALTLAAIAVGGSTLPAAAGAVAAFLLVALAAGFVGRADWAILRRALERA